MSTPLRQRIRKTRNGETGPSLLRAAKTSRQGKKGAPLMTCLLFLFFSLFFKPSYPSPRLWSDWYDTVLHLFHIFRVTYKIMYDRMKTTNLYYGSYVRLRGRRATLVRRTFCDASGTESYSTCCGNTSLRITTIASPCASNTNTSILMDSGTARTGMKTGSSMPKVRAYDDRFPRLSLSLSLPC